MRKFQNGEKVPSREFLETLERIGFEADCRRRNAIDDGSIPVRFNRVPFWKWFLHKFVSRKRGIYVASV